MEKEATKPKKKVLTEEEKAARMEAARKYTDTLVDKAVAAESEYAHFTQNQVDKIVAAAALAGSEAALMLAHEAVEETNRGVVEDKDTKNRFATENIYNAIKDEKTVGIIAEDKIKGEVQIAAPLGVLAGIVPTTNPTSTAMFKSLMALKTRNAIVFAFHPQAQKCSVHAAQIVYEAAVAAGAPKNIIQWVETPSIENTTALIQNRKIASILATGGPGMVNAALKSGNPSMGVGAGNGAVFVDHTAHLDRAVEDLLLSKRFDNGMICATENSVVIEAPVYKDWMKKMEEKGAYLLPKKDYEKLADFVGLPKMPALICLKEKTSSCLNSIRRTSAKSSHQKSFLRSFRFIRQKTEKTASRSLPHCSTTKVPVTMRPFRLVLRQIRS